VKVEHEVEWDGSEMSNEYVSLFKRKYDLQIPTTPQMAAREKRVKQLTERINNLVEEVSSFFLLL